MTDTLWSDVSEFNPLVNSQYNLRALAIRSNDGTYKDDHFANNLAWCKHACDTGRMDFFIVYLVYEPNWRQTFETFKKMVGKPHPKMAVMIDMESWSGKIRGDQSPEANALRDEVARWLMLEGKRRRKRAYKAVLGYGNMGDLTALWPKRGKNMWLVVADYTEKPVFPGMLAHQFANDHIQPPFGKSDINSADGMAPLEVAAALGLAKLPAGHKPPKPQKHRKHFREPYWWERFWRHFRRMGK